MNNDKSVSEKNFGKDVRLACATQSVLGEGPVYVAEEESVYWVDIKGAAVHWLNLASQVHDSWRMPEPIGWIVPRQNDPGFIAGFKSGFARLFLKPLRIEPIGAPENGMPHNRLNDAAVDRAGCIWAGTMDDREAEATGSLYRLDTGGNWTREDSGYVVSNGPAFSPDHRFLYHTDTAKGLIYRFRRSDEGRLSDKQVFVEFADGWGSPDGMATDAEGGIWVAHWGGGRLSRFLPDGTLDQVIGMPVAQVTSCCFAGAGLERMFVTTASIGRENEPHAGCLFEVWPGVSGAPCYRYGG